MAGLLAGIGLWAGCDDGGARVCGPGDAPAAGVTSSAGEAGATIAYGQFTSSPNNDCPRPGGGLTSITVDGVQTDPTPSIPYHMTFCLPRPEQIDDGPISLADDSLVQVIDVWAELPDGCRLHLDRSAPPEGTIEFLGYCEAGLAPEGYAITLDATIPGERICDDLPNEPVTIYLGGTVSVAAQ